MYSRLILHDDDKKSRVAIKQQPGYLIKTRGFPSPNHLGFGFLDYF